MPLPLIPIIIGAVGLATGGVGIGKGIKGLVDHLLIFSSPHLLISSSPFPKTPNSSIKPKVLCATKFYAKKN